MRALGFSFTSYLFILFVIIVVDTFHARDFVFERAATITIVYVTALLIYFAVLFVVFKRKIDASK